MKRIAWILWMAALAWPALAAGQTPPAPPVPAAPEPVKPTLHVHLVRNVDVDALLLRLGQIAVVHGDDEAAVAKAEALSLGRSPWPGRSFVLVRPVILARLASQGFPATKVRLSGATLVRVTRRAQRVETEEVSRLATEFVQGRRLDGDDSTLELLGKPAPMILSSDVTYRLGVKIETMGKTGPVIVQVAALDDKEQVLARSRVTFRRAYQVKQVVALKDLAPGEKITKENTEVRTVASPVPPPAAKIHDPYGQVVVRGIRKEQKLHDQDTRAASSTAKPAKSSVTVESGQMVFMKVRGQGFVITALGVAMQGGRQGGMIEVRNADTQRVVRCQIMPDGTLRPTALGAEPSS